MPRFSSRQIIFSPKPTKLHANVTISKIENQKQTLIIWKLLKKGTFFNIIEKHYHCNAMIIISKKLYSEIENTHIMKFWVPFLVVHISIRNRFQNTFLLQMGLHVYTIFFLALNWQFLKCNLQGGGHFRLSIIYLPYCCWQWGFLMHFVDCTEKNLKWFEAFFS